MVGTRADSIGLQEFQIGSAATFAGQGESTTFTVALPSDHRGLRVDGRDVAPGSFIAFRETEPLTFASNDVTRWVGVSVPTNTSMIAPELFDRDSRRGPRWCTRLAPLVRLQELIRRFVSAGEPLDEPAAAKTAAEEIALCVARMLEHSREFTDRSAVRPQLSRKRVISRSLMLIEANLGQPLFIEDLCRATQVSERTLRNIFNEYFGVGPMRLLKVRQLHEIRAALLRAEPPYETVSKIAARHGVWDFSLFARNYKALFGEAPSRTLRTPSTAARKGDGKLSWLELASRIFIDDAVRRPRPLAPVDATPVPTDSGESADEPTDERASTPLLPFMRESSRPSKRR